MRVKSAPSERYDTVTSAARRMRISIDAVQKLCQAGKIRAIKVNNHWHILKADVDRRIAEKNGR